MRYKILVAAAALAMSALPAIADENFIPVGRDYGLGSDGVPPINSEQSKFNAQVDVYQAEVYNRNINQKVFDSRIFNLANEQQPSDLDDNDLDY